MTKENTNHKSVILTNINIRNYLFMRQKEMFYCCEYHINFQKNSRKVKAGL